jgi:hypothetical protein
MICHKHLIAGSDILLNNIKAKRASESQRERERKCPDVCVINQRRKITKREEVFMRFASPILVLMEIIQKITQTRSQVVLLGSCKVTRQRFAPVVAAIVPTAATAAARDCVVMIMPSVRIIIHLLHSDVLEGLLQRALPILVIPRIDNKNIRLILLRLVLDVINIPRWLHRTVVCVRVLGLGGPHHAANIVKVQFITAARFISHHSVIAFQRHAVAAVVELIIEIERRSRSVACEWHMIKCIEPIIRHKRTLLMVMVKLLLLLLRGSERHVVAVTVVCEFDICRRCRRRFRV